MRDFQVKVYTSIPDGDYTEGHGTDPGAEAAIDAAIQRARMMIEVQRNSLIHPTPYDFDHYPIRTQEKAQFLFFFPEHLNPIQVGELVLQELKQEVYPYYRFAYGEREILVTIDDELKAYAEFHGLSMEGAPEYQLDWREFLQANPPTSDQWAQFYRLSTPPEPGEELPEDQVHDYITRQGPKFFTVTVDPEIPKDYTTADLEMLDLSPYVTVNIPQEFPVPASVQDGILNLSRSIKRVPFGPHYVSVFPHLILQVTQGKAVLKDITWSVSVETKEKTDLINLLYRDMQGGN